MKNKYRTSTTYYSNGQKDFVHHYKNNQENGAWSYWYPDGIKEAIHHYKNGKKHGLCYLYDPNGNLHTVIHYKKNRSISKKRFKNNVCYLHHTSLAESIISYKKEYMKDIIIDLRGYDKSNFDICELFDKKRNKKKVPETE